MTKKKETKDDFIKKLSKMTPEEINNLIKENGKKGKPLQIFRSLK